MKFLTASLQGKKSGSYLTTHADEMETIPTEDEIEKCKSALKEKEQGVNAVQKKLAEMEKELETLRSTSCTCATSQPGEWKTQKNGLPRAGVIPKDLAEKSGMMELMPNSGVFVYPKDIRLSGKKESGTAMARYLMSVFYTNEELVLRGNLMGTNGKNGLNRQIVNTIIAFAVIKGKDTESAIKYSMRTKISALISHERKKTNVDN
uniref:BEN domain-containing protein n=1 Tax=Magallana gigas TaxID=29159 RepID=A0A8W8JHM5_MAGGI|nr:uncharacterized protein LOC117691949 [Crassostrea gigas]